MDCPNCGRSMTGFLIRDWPEGYHPKHGERAMKVTAVIYHCGGVSGCQHQVEKLVA